MSRRCELTGVGPMVGHNVSHSNRHTKRRFEVNLKDKRFWLEDEKRWKIRNKMNMGPVLPGAGDASLRAWLPDPIDLTNHPDYFARNADGSRCICRSTGPASWP